MKTRRKLPLYGIVLFGSLFIASCSTTKLVTTGAKDHKPLIFNGEYKTSDLEEIDVQGYAFCGIPSFSKNNKNNHKNAFLFTFNGVELFKTKRIFPTLSLIGYSFLSQSLVQRAAGYKKEEINGEKYSTGEERLGFTPSYIIGLPIAGMLNNLTWNNSALSGASATFNYRLVSENPNVDVFYYPKYEIKKENIFSDQGIRLKYLFVQEASLKGRVQGATLIKTP
jgi:hypothetical protein